jgi:hypothetical protein
MQSRAQPGDFRLICFLASTYLRRLELGSVVILSEQLCELVHIEEGAVGWTLSRGKCLKKRYEEQGPWLVW